MRRVPILPLLTALVVAPLSAQSAEIVERYEQDRAAVLELVEGLSPEQWDYKPAPDRWSMAEILEHVILNEKMVWEVLADQLQDAEVTEESRAQAEALEGMVTATLGDRTERFQAPDYLEPTGRWAGGEEVLGMFKEVRHAMLSWFREAEFDLRTKSALHPILQADMDAHTWAVVAVEHSARHQQQMVELMEDAGFPGR